MERNEARAIFGSVIPAMVRPFAEDGSIDFDAAARLADHLVGQGCDGILLSGTTGESPTTHTSEKNELIRVVKEADGDRARIMAGAGSNDTKHAVRIGEQAVESGADSLLVVSPYYNKPSQEGIAAHILAVARPARPCIPAMMRPISVSLRTVGRASSPSSLTSRPIATARWSMRWMRETWRARPRSTTRCYL